nr:S49 family peptidase [Bradyrhizobium pachyrhizi]
MARIAAEIIGVPLYLEPRKAATIAAVLGERIGIDGDMEPVLRRAGQPLATRAPVRGKAAAGYVKIGGGIALVPVVGSLVTRAGGLDAESGLVSYDAVSAGVRAADADPEVTSILLDIHSPGGSAAGAIECADVVHAVAQKRPVVAVCNSLCCSAGYVIAAAANRIVATKTATIGSIGVVMLHVDQSRQLAGKGLVPTFIFAGEHKVDANGFEPLSDAIKADLQSEVDAYYNIMIESIAGHRPMLSAAAIRGTEARTYLGVDAVGAGLADEIGSMDATIVALARLHPETTKAFDKYAKLEFLYGPIDATRERLKDAHAAGTRAGMAAALAAGRTA